MCSKLRFPKPSKILILLGWALIAILFVLTLSLSVKLGYDFFCKPVKQSQSVISLTASKTGDVPEAVLSNTSVLSTPLGAKSASAQKIVTLSNAERLNLKEAVKNDVMQELRKISPPAPVATLENKPEDNTKDAVANAMTAIGTAVAVLALMLSMGTYYIEMRQRQLDQLVQAEQERAALHEHWLNLLFQLSKAKLATLNWVAANASTQANFVMTQEIGIYLELLMSQDVETRFKAFERLQDYFDNAAEMTRDLQVIHNFSQECKRYHEQVFLASLVGQKVKQLKLEQKVAGAWCEILNPEEINAHRKERKKRQID